MFLFVSTLSLKLNVSLKLGKDFVDILTVVCFFVPKRMVALNLLIFSIFCEGISVKG